MDLVGCRTVVRAYRPSNAPAVWDAIEETRVSLARWIPDIARRNSQAEVRASLELLEKARVRGDRLLYGIWRRTDRHFLGEVGLHDLDWKRRTASVGYWLRPGLRGQGLIDEALELLQGHAIRGLGLARLEAHIARENPASRRVAERHGYLLTGQRPADPVWDGEAGSVLIYTLALEEIDVD